MGGGGGVYFVVLASEPVGGRSRAIELPCFMWNEIADIYMTNNRY